MTPKQKNRKCHQLCFRNIWSWKNLVTAPRKTAGWDEVTQMETNSRAIFSFYQFVFNLTALFREALSSFDLLSKSSATRFFWLLKISLLGMTSFTVSPNGRDDTFSPEEKPGLRRRTRSGRRGFLFFAIVVFSRGSFLLFLLLFQVVQVFLLRLSQHLRQDVRLLTPIGQTWKSGIFL